MQVVRFRRLISFRVRAKWIFVKRLISAAKCPTVWRVPRPIDSTSSSSSSSSRRIGGSTDQRISDQRLNRHTHTHVGCVVAVVVALCCAIYVWLSLDLPPRRPARCPSTGQRHQVAINSQHICLFKLEVRVCMIGVYPSISL